MRKLVSSIVFLLAAHMSLTAAALPLPISGKSVISGEQVAVSGSTKKGLVVVFLSAVCPCSNSHLVELKGLKNEFPDFEFVGVHSNADEGKDLTTSYFKTASLPFPVIQDTGAKLADQFKALKTPHVFVVLNDGTFAYQGGVSSSRHFDDKTDRKYLREALSDLSAGRKVKTAEGRTLGCVISRGEKHVW
jgi:hypothetical protein